MYNPGDTCQHAAAAMQTTVAGTTWWNGHTYVPCPAQLYLSDVLLGCPVAGYPPVNCQFYGVGPGQTCASIAGEHEVPVTSVTLGGLACNVPLLSGFDYVLVYSSNVSVGNITCTQRPG